MLKKILTGIVFFIVGFGIGYFTDSFFRHIIQDLFQWSTNGGIQFSGKDFYLFGNPFSYIGFGLIFLIFSIANWKTEFLKILRNGSVLVLVFGIALVGISSLSANQKIIECTICENGIRRLDYHEINYGLILAISTVLSLIPSVIIIIKNKKASVQQRL